MPTFVAPDMVVILGELAHAASLLAPNSKRADSQLVIAMLLLRRTTEKSFMIKPNSSMAQQKNGEGTVRIGRTLFMQVRAVATAHPRVETGSMAELGSINTQTGVFHVSVGYRQVVTAGRVRQRVRFLLPPRQQFFLVTENSSGGRGARCRSESTETRVQSPPGAYFLRSTLATVTNTMADSVSPQEYEQRLLAAKRALKRERVRLIIRNPSDHFVATSTQLQPLTPYEYTLCAYNALQKAARAGVTRPVRVLLMLSDGGPFYAQNNFWWEFDEIIHGSTRIISPNSWIAAIRDTCESIEIVLQLSRGFSLSDFHGCRFYGIELMHNQIEMTPESFEMLKVTNSVSITFSREPQLPESLFKLHCLTSLTINGCFSLTSLPEELGCLQALETLVINGCFSLKTLPESLGRLHALTALKISGCDLLTSLPDSLGELQSLVFLVIQQNNVLTSLPDSLGVLSGLRLEVRSCKTLQSIPRKCWKRMTHKTAIPSVFHGPLATELLLFPVNSRALRRSLVKALPVKVSRQEIRAALQPQMFALLACCRRLGLPRLPVELWYMIWDIFTSQCEEEIRELVSSCRV